MTDRASPRLGRLGCVATALAYVVGWAPVVYWVAAPAELRSESGLWLFGAGMAAGFFNLLAFVLAAASLITRRAHVPRASPWLAIVSIVVAVIGFGGVLLLLLGGTFILIPIPVH